MSSLSAWEEIRRIAVNSESGVLLQALASEEPEYGHWYRQAKISGFGNLTPLEVVSKYGKESLIRYLDHKVLGGYE